MNELLTDYKDFLLFCYDHDIITPDEFYHKLNWVYKLEKL